MISIQLQKAFSRNLLSSSLDILATTMAYILILDWFIEKKLHRGHEAHPWTPLRGKNVLVQGSAPHSGMLDYFEIKTGLTKNKSFTCQVVRNIYITTIGAGQRDRQKPEQDSTVLLDSPGTLYIHAFSQLLLSRLQEKCKKNGWTARREAC